MAPLRVIAAAVVEDDQLLLVAKHAAPSVFYLPGGKPDDGEAPLRCLAREVREELGAGLAGAEPFADVRAPAALEGVPMLMSVYLAALDGRPAPAAEIAALAWWPRDRGIVLAPAIREHVIPALRDAGRL
jgi:8-oxo-dGTP diphosphatase